MASEKTNLDTLPEEVMEMIVSCCDGMSLVNLSKTCRRWNQCIQNNKKYILQKWGSVCRNEMNVDFILDILQTLYPKYWLGDEVYWKSVYKCWKQSTQLSHWKPSIDVMDKKSKNYNFVIKFSGKWVLIVTKNEGLLEAVNFETKQKLILYQCDSIDDLYVRCHASGGQLENGVEPLLVGIEHDEAIIVLLRGYIFFDLRTGQATPWNKLRSLLTFKCFERTEVIIKHFRLSEVSVVDNVAGTKKVIRKSEHIYPNVLQVWNGMILMMDYDERSGRGIFQVLDYDLKNLEHPWSNKELDPYCFLHNSRKFCYHLGVVIAFNGGKFEVHVDGETRTYNMQDNLPSKILCCLYHAGLLLIGTDLGEIYGYRVKKDEDLLSLNLRFYDFHIDVCSEPLVAIDLKETPEKPIIAAASPLQIYIIRFD